MLILSSLSTKELHKLSVIYNIQMRTGLLIDFDSRSQKRASYPNIP